MKKKLLKGFVGVMGLAIGVSLLASCDMSLAPTYERNDKETSTEIPASVTPTPSRTPTSTPTTTTSTKEEYTITYDTQGGSAISPSKSADGSVNKVNDPIKDGYTFDGWYLNGHRFSFDTTINSNITLKAGWIRPINVSISSILSGNGKTYNEPFMFNEKAFNHDSDVYDKDIAMFAMGSSFVNNGSKTTLDFFKGFNFDNVKNLPSEEEYDGICFTFAHKELDKSDLFVASVKGFDYGQEWAGNFNVGKTGNHYDFDRSAGIVFDALKKYVNDNKVTNNVKLLLTGYSRGGAVANLLADKVLSATDKITLDKNVYAYTFEAPKGMLKENAKEYKNVFNIVNNADIITKIVPDSFNFARCGIDINIYSDKIDELLNTFDNGFVINKFTSSSDYTNEDEHSDYIIDNIFIYTDTYGDYVDCEIKDRDTFVDNFGDEIQFIMKIVFGIKPVTRVAIMADVTSKGMMDLAMLLFTPNGIHDYIKPFLDNDGIKYDDNDLLKVCNKIPNILASRGTIVSIAMNQEKKANVIRMIGMHYPIINYVLFKNYEYKA